MKAFLLLLSAFGSILLRCLLACLAAQLFSFSAFSVETPSASPRQSIIVRTQEQLVAALATGAARVFPDQNITIDTAVAIDRDDAVEFGRYKFIYAAGGSISFNGDCIADRQQIFSGFAAGAITGTFNGHDVPPQWWGLDNGATSAVTTGKHDVAINCAIKTYVPGTSGNRITLGPGIYYVSGPIDMRDSLSYLVGAGAGATEIRATSAWTATWAPTNLWAWTAGTNHAPLIWFGSNVISVQAYRSGISGITLDCKYATFANPTKYISGISGTGSVEELSTIRDVVIRYFSGFGVGFHNSSGEGALNGFTLTSFWIYGSIRRDSIPIYLNNQSYVCAVRDGTVDCIVRLENTTGDNAFTWPTYGIVARGRSVIENVHMEGMQVGIGVIQTGATSDVAIRSVDVNHLMRGTMTYFDEPVIGYTVGDPANRNRLIAPTLARGAALGNWSAALSVLRTNSHQNTIDSVVAHQIKTVGQCDYIVHDPVYGVLETSLGQGQFPQSDSGCVKEFLRNNTYGEPTGAGTAVSPFIAGTPYTYPGALPTDKTYFRIVR